MYTIMAFCLSGIVMIIFGILIRECKCYNLIAGYNTMPAEKKKSYNPAPLANQVGIFLYWIGTFTIVFGIILHFVEYSKLLATFITVGYSVILLVAAIIFIAKEAKGLNDI
ncbi:DUF3784 domain-containing protein [Treponema denticola]|uniref:DUF3784 domain-containing protein n=1 Tax=Treponema denticola TaxID=158 RepID=UPI0020A3B9FF|nr:DUF3784 domain-containing protein [Treponema denticola]UTD12281.1 DUF3784 domain-containing protein [Treponema denticola]